ncbi:MAG: hypothetical protein ACK5TQ_09560, partial [Acetobacteraceae bacterium]
SRLFCAASTRSCSRSGASFSRRLPRAGRGAAGVAAAAALVARFALGAGFAEVVFAAARFGAGLAAAVFGAAFALGTPAAFGLALALGAALGLGLAATRRFGLSSAGVGLRAMAASCLCLTVTGAALLP